jgi:serine phosphatase RsbU (regulator of sigma subunit)
MVARRPIHIDDPEGPAKALRMGEPVLDEVVDEADLRAIATDERHLAQMRKLGVTSSLIVPLRSPQRPIGTITLAYSGSGRRYGPEDVTMAEALAAWAGLHVENARLYTERSLIATTLQEGLLPAQLPEVPGVDLAARYRPAGQENQVGGDFYDVFPIRDGRWAAVIGDVSGKGASAAALTALARHTLFAGALRGDDVVADLLLLNDAILQRGGGSGTHFCTVVMAELTRDGAGGLSVRMANGGHPAPLVVRADGTVEETSAGGTLIGAVEHPELRAQELTLRPGDLLVAFTDGATELRGPDPGEGERVLRACLAAHAGRPAGTVAAALERAIVDAAGDELSDDLALLVLGPAVG